MGADLIDESEKEDLLKAVRRLGYDPGDFDIIGGAKSYPQGAGDIYAIRQEVTVHRKSAGIRKTYEGGHGRAWAAAAELDVRAGAFGPPPPSS